MSEQAISLLSWLALPVLSLLLLALSLLVRSKGSRALHVNLRAFGVELTIDSNVPKKEIPCSKE